MEGKGIGRGNRGDKRREERKGKGGKREEKEEKGKEVVPLIFHNVVAPLIISHHFSHVHATFWLGIEQCSNRHRNLVPDESGHKNLHDTRTRNQRPKKWSLFTVPVSAACVMGIKVPTQQA